MSKVTMWRSRWRRVINPAYSVSFLLSINIFVWQNILYFPKVLRVCVCVYCLTRLSIRQLLKCIFNHISQLHVSARPSGAILRLNFYFKKGNMCKWQCLLVIRSRITLCKILLVKIQYTRFGTLIVATIYLQLIQNRYRFRSFTVLQCSHQHCLQPVASDVEVVGYL